MNTIPREEYPRPQFVREEWKNLNGTWDFAYDDEDTGIRQEWYEGHTYDKKIIVPFVCQSQRSGIGNTDIHDIVWYHRRFLAKREAGKRTILHIGASDYRTDIWVNACYIGRHEGGHTSFAFDITQDLREDKEDQTVTIRVEDESRNLELPRGKQYWREHSEGIFYTRSTGIWQSVWLETVCDNHLKKVRMTPDTDHKIVKMELISAKHIPSSVQVRIEYEGRVMVDDSVSVLEGKAVRTFQLDPNIHLEWEHRLYEWTPENPKLFTVSFVLTDEEGNRDSVSSYFAMRKVSVENGRFLLNNRPYYQKLLLDQGYWRESLMTAPDDEAFIKDITLCKEMGFNGVRKHQKVEDPRFLYWADTLGLLVWEEYANAYLYSVEYVQRMLPEWMEVIERDYNHPCIIAWVPLNESWGVDGIMYNREEQSHAQSLYYLTKSLDDTRLVISNDGWNHTKSDLLSVHDYTADTAAIKKRYSETETLLADMPTNRTLFAKGFSYEGQPIIVSEFGGISWKSVGQTGWGYSEAASEEEFIERYRALMEVILQAETIQGYVYTQFYDLEQEVNGLLTYEREYKIPPAVIREINGSQ